MRLMGIGAAPGFAVGPAWRHREAEGPNREQGAIPAGVVDPRAIAALAAAQLEDLAERLRSTGRTEEAGIFEAQALMATDPVLLDEWRHRIDAGENPVAAIQAAAGAVAQTLAELGDSLLAARATDVRDVGARLARLVSGGRLDRPTLPSIAIADDLPPSTTAEIPAGLLLGIALQAGSRTAHAAILARGLGIPCVVGVSGLLAAAGGEAIARGDRDGHATPPIVALDGATGDVILDPTPGELEALRRREETAAAGAALARSFRDRPAATSDGHRVPLLANIGGPADVERALAAGADGVGLFRTEFLFMGRHAAPTEDEQAEAYRSVFAAFGPDRPVVVRLADIGGDKGIPYLALPPESNPFLGVRALRLAYADRGMLVTQLRAVSTAAALAGVVPHVMAPMVATLDDVALLRSLVDEAQAGLRAAGRPTVPRMMTGIMVEIPSAAIIADALARRVDFFSIGTNDLTQYLMAADRTNPSLAGLQEALHPAVTRAIRMVVEAADAAGIPVAVCGELAGDPAGALVLVGLGVDELSADAGSLDTLRMVLASVTLPELEDLAGRALAASNGAAVRAMAQALVARATSPRVA